MARTSFQVTLGSSLGEGKYNSSVATRDSVVTLTGTANGTLRTDVAAAVAVLVADGASPTQAHVNTLNTAWGLLNTAIQAANAAATGDVVVDIDNATVANQNAARAAVRKALEGIAGSGLATG